MITTCSRICKECEEAIDDDVYFTREIFGLSFYWHLACWPWKGRHHFSLDSGI